MHFDSMPLPAGQLAELHAAYARMGSRQVQGKLVMVNEQ